MNNLLYFLNSFGIQVDKSTPFEVLISGYYLILSVLILLNVINVIIYLLSIYIVTNKIINKIPERYTYVHKFLIYYKNIRVIYIIGEFIFILVFLIMMISVGYGVVSLYIQYK